MKNNPTLVLLRLEGALQSWGDHAKWDERDSGDFPSKSGVVGLLACALGLERGDPEVAQLSAQLHMAVRADRPGVRLLDFQTVRGNPRLRTAENGLRAEDKSTIVSPRWYLQDASFLAALELGEAWRERVVAALKRPTWPIYLGRKNCVPSRPVLEGVTRDYAGLIDAMERCPLAWREEDGDPPEVVSYECELPQPTAGSYSRTDDRLSGGRDFAPRTVYRVAASITAKREAAAYVPDED